MKNLFKNKLTSYSCNRCGSNKLIPFNFFWKPFIKPFNNLKKEVVVEKAKGNGIVYICKNCDAKNCGDEYFDDNSFKKEIKSNLEIIYRLHAGDISRLDITFKAK
jgi:hypothetical protein